MFSFGIIAENFEVFERVYGILLVSSFCDICSAVSRPISWARCLSVVTVEFFEGLAHFLAFVV